MMPRYGQGKWISPPWHGRPRIACLELPWRCILPVVNPAVDSIPRSLHEVVKPILQSPSLLVCRSDRRPVIAWSLPYLQAQVHLQ